MIYKISKSWALEGEFRKRVLNSENVGIYPYLNTFYKLRT